MWFAANCVCSAFLAASLAQGQQVEVASSPSRRTEGTSPKAQQALAGAAIPHHDANATLRPVTRPGRAEAVFWPPEEYNHRFWDRSNILLFSGVGAARALDFASTRHFRARGRSEGFLNNRIVDNRPLFITVEAAGAAASIGVSYFFHRIGQHKLERWTSLVHITVGTAGAVRNYRADGYRPSVVQAWAEPQR